MTTDTVPKGASRRIAIDGVPVTVTGIAKGSGMIHPDMATMLAFVATDAPIAAGLLATATREIAAVSFNCATIDGDTSTNDSFVHRRHRQARRSPPIARRRRSALRAASRRAVWRWRPSSRRRSSATARARPSSSPSRVDGGRDVAECRRVAFAIAHSPLVKTAFFASDPNLGRIVCAIGNAAAGRPRSGARVVLARRRARRRQRRARGVLHRGGRPARDEAGRDHRPRRRSAAATRRRRSGRATSRTTTSASTPTTAARMNAPHGASAISLALACARRRHPRARRRPAAAGAVAHRLERARVSLAQARGPRLPQAVLHPHAIRLDDLVAIDEQKHAIDANTRQFVAGLPANNVLLTGSRGTGKSSLVKAMLVKYAAKGLRLIEVDKSDLVDLPDIAARSRGAARALHRVLRRPDASTRASPATRRSR